MASVETSISSRGMISPGNKPISDGRFTAAPRPGGAEPAKKKSATASSRTGTGNGLNLKTSVSAARISRFGADERYRVIVLLPSASLPTLLLPHTKLGLSGKTVDARPRAYIIALQLNGRKNKSFGMRTKTILSLTAVIATAVLCPLSSHAQWVQSTRGGNIAYFLFGTSPRLERFSLTTGQWLPTLTLPTVYGPA